MTRVALVTGGGRGIGRAISRRLAADGFAVAVNYRRDQAAAEATAAEIGGRAYQASVAERAGCTGLAETVLADYGRVDVLVCNAGIASRGNTETSSSTSRPHTSESSFVSRGLAWCSQRRKVMPLVLLTMRSG